MAIPFPDILEHNNPNNPLMDVNQLEGITNILNLIDRDTIPLAKRKLAHQVNCYESQGSFIYIGADVTDINWINTSNWKVSGEVSIADLEKKQDVNVGICQTCPILHNDVVRDVTNRTLTISTFKGGITIDTTNPLHFFTRSSDLIIDSWSKTSSQSVQWSDTLGLKYIFFDTDGVLKSQDTPWTIGNIVAVWRLYWNPALTGLAKIVREAYECHPNSTSAEDHSWKHSFGAIWVRGSGLDIINNKLASGTPSTTGSNTCLSLTSGKCMDDNLVYKIVNVAVDTPTSSDFAQDLGTISSTSLTFNNSSLIEISYNDASNVLTVLPATRFPFHFVGDVPQIITASGTITPVSNGNFFNYYIYTFQDPRSGKVVNLRSGGQYSSLTLAQNETWEQIKALSPTLSDGEVRQLYKCTFEYRSIYNAAIKKSALRNIIDLRSNAAIAISTSSASVLASNVITSPTATYTSLNQQDYNIENDARVVKLESDEIPAAIADTDNVRFKSGTGWYNRTLLAIKNYVKLGLKASEVANDSNIIGITVTDVFNSADAIEVMSLTNGDMIALARMNGAVSENKMIEAVNAKIYFSTDLSPFYSHSADTSIHFTKSAINFSDLGSTAHTHTVSDISDFYNASYSASYNVTSWQEIVDILAVSTVPNSVVFNVMNDIVGGTLQTFAHNVIIRGCKVIAPSIMQISGYEDGVYNINFESLYYNNNASVIMVGNDEFTTTINIKFKDITSLWYNTSANYNLQCLTIGTGTTASIEYNALTNTKLDAATTLVPTQNNNYYKWNYYYDIYMFNINSEIHFLCDRAGKFSVRCRYLCSTTSNRTITLIPPLPLKLNLHDLVTSAIEFSEGLTWVYGTETINKFRYNNEPLAISSTLSDINDKIEYRNPLGVGTPQYTNSEGIVDISTSGLTLELNYSGNASGYVKKEIVIAGIITKKLQ